MWDIYGKAGFAYKFYRNKEYFSELNKENL